MKLSFRRITSSGGFIPEIDGLRFIAIFSVVLYHITVFFKEKDKHQYVDTTNYSFLKRLLLHGHLGVPLFFVISGFILSTPFAKWRLINEKSVNLQSYFVRRLTRLEPPYILVMTVLLFAAVYVAKTISISTGLKSYLASLAYFHNFIYGRDILPLLNVPAWSLEVEVQFYLLMPLLAILFLIKFPIQRRLSLLVMILFFIILNNTITIPFVSLFNFIQYFLTGLLLADFYVTKSVMLPKTRWDGFIAFLFLITIWAYDKTELYSNVKKVLWETLQMTCIFFFYYYILFHKALKVFTIPAITGIGGMCYSIYLLHYPLISMVGNQLTKMHFSNYSYINIGAYIILLLFVILTVASVFFLLIERPCMDKYWINNFLITLRHRKSQNTSQFPNKQ